MPRHNSANWTISRPESKEGRRAGLFSECGKWISHQRPTIECLCISSHPQFTAHNASWNANLTWPHAHAQNIRQPKSPSRRCRWAFGKWGCQMSPSGLSRKLDLCGWNSKQPNLYLVSTKSVTSSQGCDPQTFRSNTTKAARLPPSTFSLDERVSNVSESG